MSETPFVPVGRIVKVHGLNGEVSVVPAAGPPFALPEGLSVWIVPPPADPAALTIESVRTGPKGPLVKLSGVDSRPDAEALRGRTLLAHSADLPDEWAELGEDDVGLAVVDVARGPIGTVADVIVTGANDVWVVQNGPFGEVLVPVIDDVVVTLDRDAGVATVRLLPGLIDEEDVDA